jgi:N-acetylmuramoyl-L-alanine amidase
LKLKDILKELDYKVVMTRQTDIFLDFSERCRIANVSGAALFVSIHHNAGGGIGYDVIYEVDKPITKRLAEVIGAEFEELGQRRHRIFCKPSTKANGRDWFGILQAKMPTLITEYAFMDSEKEKIDTFREQWDEAGAIASAIDTMFREGLLK